MMADNNVSRRSDRITPEFVDDDNSICVLSREVQEVSAGAAKIIAFPQKQNLESGNFRKSYTTEFKLSVVEWVERHKSSVRAAAKQFNVDRKLVRMWMEHKRLLNSALLQHGPHRRKLHAGRPPASLELDQLTFDYLCEQRRMGAVVRDRDLQQKALTIARHLGMDSFKATGQWIRRWRQRCGVRLANGTNEVDVNNHLLSPSSTLSRVNPDDQVLLLQDDMQVQPICTPPPPSPVGPVCAPPPLPSPVGPVYVNYFFQEHNYCQPCEQTSDDNPTAFCDVIEGLDLSLSHEEVVDGEGGSVGGHNPHACRTSLRCHKYHASFTDFKMADANCANCNLLASRISVPIFPTGPEIVYVDVPGVTTSAW